MNTDPDNYTLYGIERLDQHVTGGYTTSTDQDNRHLQRFLIACTEAKARINALWEARSVVGLWESTWVTRLRGSFGRTRAASAMSTRGRTHASRGAHARA